jgi:hypothetical protein
MRRSRISLVAVALLCAAALAACGSSSSTTSSSTTSSSTTSSGTSSSQPSTSAPSSPTSTASPPASSTPAAPPNAVSTKALPPAVAELGAAERPALHEFPAAHGHTLISLARLVKATATLGPANGVFTPGAQRFAFALTDKANRYIYAPTAIYLAATPSSPAQGPFLAPDDPMGVAHQYRSEENAGPGGLQAIYSTTLPLSHSGIFDVLAVSDAHGELIGSTGEVAVADSSPIPGVGQRPPDIATDTLATVHGDVALLTTRVPPESMHSVSFNQVLGKRPVALLFSTPELCISRVCGPVTDIMVALQHQFGDRITFIHEEVYIDNNPSKGLRPQLRAFHLETEPWLFAVNAKGIITARLQGAFGIHEATAALESALRS